MGLCHTRAVPGTDVCSYQHCTCCLLWPLRSRSCLGAPATIAAGTAGIPGEARAGAASQLPSHDEEVTAPLKTNSGEGNLEENEGPWPGTKWQTQCLT